MDLNAESRTDSVNKRKLILVQRRHYLYFVSSIDKLVDKANNGEDVESQVEKLRLKLKRFRQSGLDDGGEYSYENLTFKLLRRNGYIEKLLGLKKKLIDKKLSVEY